jgi:hypothetical protein
MSRPLLASLALALVAACSSSQTTGDGEPGYNVMPKGELHGIMWQISQSLDTLDSVMQSPSAPVDKRAEAVAILARLETQTRKLTDVKYRHPLLEQNLDFFLDNIVRARAAAEADPPNYYLAGTVSGSCIYCHDPEGGIRAAPAD